jgi:hypothetical protein
MHLVAGAMAQPQRRRLAATAAHLTKSPRADGAAAAPPAPFVGNTEQGFGIRATAQPPVFDPLMQHAEAFQFYQEHRYVVVHALSAEEVREMNEIADTGWLLDYAHVPSELMVFYPLLDYPAVDKFIKLPSTMPLISQMLGGWENVRFQEFNWRYYPENYGAPSDGSPPPAGSFGMRFHPDASLPDRFARQPYGCPDYVSAFYYLTDTHPRSPSFCVVPKSTRFRTLEEARDGLGDDYQETPIYGPAGTAILVDTAIIHTRLDGDGKAGRRIMHHAYARGGWAQNDDGGWRAPSPVNNPNNLFPQRLVEHPDPEFRRFMCLWSATQCEWVASGYDEEYRNQRPTKGSPHPAQARR